MTDEDSVVGTEQVGKVRDAQGGPLAKTTCSGEVHDQELSCQGIQFVQLRSGVDRAAIAGFNIRIACWIGIA